MMAGYKLRGPQIFCLLLVLAACSQEDVRLQQEIQKLKKQGAQTKKTISPDELNESYLPLQSPLSDFFNGKETGEREEIFGQGPFPFPWPETLRHFYQEHSYLSLWFNHQGELNSKATHFLQRLKNAEDEVLNPEDYSLANLQQLVELEKSKQTSDKQTPEKNLKNLTKLEILLSYNFLKYARDLTTGKVDPTSIDNLWNAQPRNFEANLILKRLQNESPKKILDELFPPHEGAKRLQQTLSYYRKIQPLADQITIPNGNLPLKLQQQDPRVRILRKKLTLFKDLTLSQSKHNTEEADDLFDENIEKAVKHFQDRHGLSPSGQVDKKTFDQLNLALKERIKQMEINLERWRWLPPTLGENYIIVNIANFTLSGVEKEKNVLNMKVIVGKRFRKTPVVSSAINSLTIHPVWTIPKNILSETVWPDLAKNPNYFQEKEIKIYTIENGQTTEQNPSQMKWSKDLLTKSGYIYRQGPGPKNPLGKIIFHFPNKFFVYLHDTPSPGFFSKPNRTLSSGCIRVERPYELAEFILKKSGSNWSMTEIRKLIKKGKSYRIQLTNPVPVHILYWTAWVTKKGEAHFREDIYGRDDRLAKRLY